jgi:Big-like domain-containing protein
MKRPGLILVLVALAVSWSCGGSSPMSTAPTSPASAIVSFVAVKSSTDFTSVGQTVQLTATATLSDGATQNVSAVATWQALSGGATVTSGGLVTAVASGTVTIQATYQGRFGTAVVRISPIVPSFSSMSATIDGALWAAISVSVVKIGVSSAFPSGRLAIQGTNSFTGQYVQVGLTVPAVVGTYSSAALDAWVDSPAAGTGSEGDSGTVTLATLTATGATGTFSFRASVVPFTVVTNGVFNVMF